MLSRVYDHRELAALHETAAQRHAQAAREWHELGDEERVELARRMIALERTAADIERAFAELERRRSGGTATVVSAS